MHGVAGDDMARQVEFLHQLLHGGDLVGFVIDFDVGQNQRRIDRERGEHLPCLGVVEVVETAFSVLPSNAMTRVWAPAGARFKFAACSRKTFSTSAGLSPCKIRSEEHTSELQSR